MRQAGKKAIDTLAGIEDMLSSLCGAQIGGPDIPAKAMEDGTQEVAEEDIMHGQDLVPGAPIADEERSTPEKSPSPKERLKRRRPPRQTRSNVSRPLPASNRLRKSRRVRARNNSGQRSNVNTAVQRDEGRQQDFDLKAAVPRDVDDEGRPRDYEILGTSSDDRENANVLNQMKLLAEKQLNVHKRKKDAMNAHAVNVMKRNADQCAQRMKQVAGKVSKDIINRATQIEAALPKNLSEQTAREMNTVRRETDAFAEFQRSQAKSVEVQLNKLVQTLKVERRENMEKHDAKEKEMYASAEAACESGQRLTSVLQEIDKMLDMEQFKQK